MAVTKNISLDYQDVIVIGRRGENEAVDIVWDISPLVAEFGGGTALVLAKRATDESAYPVTLTEQTDTTLTWTVSSVDSCVIGVGKVQLFWYVGNVLAKSFMWRTFVGDDITGMVGDPPEAYESWLEHLAEMGADILNDAKDEVKNAEAWAVGERGGEPVVDGDETYHNNSKYWSGVSSDYAGNAESSADAAEQSAGDAAHQVELAEAQVTLAEGQVALAQQKVQDAAAQVALATAQAQAAAGSASDASGYALAASGYASDANTYKGQAYTSAQNAAQKASDAAGYALAASGSAADANTYKGQAQGFANAASGYSDNASTYANNASGYADAASDFADAAAASATEAAGYVASLVNGKAGVLEDSASGDVVSIVPDKSVGKLYKAEVSLSPIQSLNGYDHPWAAGAGKNKFNVAERVVGQTTSGGVAVSDRYVLSNGVVTTNYDLSGYGRTMFSAQRLKAGTYTLSFKWSLTGNGRCAYSVRNMSADPKVDIVGWDATTVSPLSVSFTIQSDADVAISIQPELSAGGTISITDIQIEEGSAATSFAPYENLCPISGHTGATLYRTGKNLLNLTNANTGYVRRCTVSVADGLLTATCNEAGQVWIGTNGSVGATAASVGFAVDAYQGTTVTFSLDISVAAVIAYELDKDNKVLVVNYRVFSDAKSGSYTATNENCRTVAFRITFSEAATVGTVYSTNVQVELGSTATEYAPYAGESYTSSFGQTVYGGAFDFVSGKLVVTWAMIASYNGEILPARWISDRDVYASGATPTTGAQVCYELATPIEIDLDPTEVQTLLGLNNVWSDGEMSVDYAADLKTYIDNKIAAAVAALS